jgi:hypothetical protein
MCEIGCGKRYRHRLRKAPASRKSLRPRNRGLLILQTICASETWVNAALRPSTLTGNAKFAGVGGNTRALSGNVPWVARVSVMLVRDGILLLIQEEPG